MIFVMLTSLVFVATASSREDAKFRWHKLTFLEQQILKDTKQNKITKKHSKKHNGFSCSEDDSFPRRKITFSSRQNISICH